MNYIIYTFRSSAQAMKSELLLESQGLKARLVPLLPEIDAGCGLVLRFPFENAKEVENIFNLNNFEYQERYILLYEDDKRKPVVKKYDLS